MLGANNVSHLEDAMRTIEATTVIDAPANAVWGVLVDTARYPEWNPFIRRLDGDLVAGGRIAVEIAPPGGRPMTFRPTVTVLEPGRRLEWLGRLGLPGVFDGRHSFEVTALADGRSELRHTETFSGVLVPLTGKTLARTAEGFESMNAAVADRVAARRGEAAE